jgi:glycosyltransferase involved in cell wall biosynthesis
MKKISIIIPVYNRETLIASCMDSCLDQTMDDTDYEIIAVDDCSSDGTHAVLSSFAARYPGVVRFDRLPVRSGGAATPRNRGLDLAVGEYVLFVDSDDRIAPDTLRTAYALARAQDLDLVLIRNCNDLPLTTSATARHWRDMAHFYHACNHLFRRAGIDSLGLRFRGYMGGEDNNFTFGFMFRQPHLRWNDIFRDNCYLLNRGEIPDGGKHHVSGEADYMLAIRDAVDNSLARVADNPALADMAHFALERLLIHARRANARVYGGDADGWNGLRPEVRAYIADCFCDVPRGVDGLLTDTQREIVCALRDNTRL